MSPFTRAVPAAVRPGHGRKSSSCQYNRLPESAHIQSLPPQVHSLSVPRYQRRTKGSKNRPKTNITKDYASQIAEKQESITSLTAEIASITANIDTLKADLKEKKTALKKTEKEVASLEAKKAKADAKAAEEAKKTEAEAVLKKLLASGMSADEILEKLK